MNFKHSKSGSRFQKGDLPSRFPAATYCCCIAFLFSLSQPGEKAYRSSVLTPLLRGKRISTDYATATSDKSWDDMQQIAYIRSEDDETTVPFYRFYTTADPSGGDRRDSIEESLSGYTLEKTLGYIYADSGSGMSAVKDWYASEDHATSVTALSGYSAFETMGYGYRRYGNDLENLFGATFSGVTVECNKVFGGSLWHITYDGVQFVNNYKQGRQIQMSCRWTNTTSGTAVESVASEVGQRRDDLPNGMDQYEPYMHFGSPIVYGYVDTDYKRIFTEAIPLEFKADTAEVLGGSAWQPVLYDSMNCSKVIHYDYDELGPVMRYRQTWEFPSSLTEQDGCQMEASIHLRAGFTNVFRYHPEAGQLENMAYKWWKSGEPGGYNDKVFDITGYIFGDSDASHCLGVLVRNIDSGGSWEHILAMNLFSTDTETGEFDSACNVIYLLNYQPYQKGNNDYYYYMVVGDLGTVTNKFQALYDTRDDHQW